MKHAPTLCMLCLLLPASLSAQDVGFTRPYLEIDVAASEPGLVIEITTDEGSRVSAGDVVAKLEHDVLTASVEVARLQMESVGQLQTAEAEYALKQNRYEKMVLLRERDHASQEEVDFSKTEAEVAKARLRSAKESLEVKRAEYERAKAQLERRMVRSPVDGFVTSIDADRGEFLPATNPVVMRIVQLDPLVAVFTLRPETAARIKVGDVSRIQFRDRLKTKASGKVSFVSPVNNPENDTVLVKIEIPNAEFKYRSGTQCTLIRDNISPGRKPAQQPVQATRSRRSVR